MNNSITIVGYVGQEPTIKTFADTGNKVVKFSVAVKDYSSHTDEERTMWFDVDAWNGLADRVLNTVTKGREVVVTGRLTLSTYSKEVGGMTLAMSKPVVILTGFHLCGKKPASQNTAQPESTDNTPRKRRPKAKG